MISTAPVRGRRKGDRFTLPCHRCNAERAHEALAYYTRTWLGLWLVFATLPLVPTGTKRYTDYRVRCVSCGEKTTIKPANLPPSDGEVPSQTDRDVRRVVITLVYEAERALMQSRSNRRSMPLTKLSIVVASVCVVATVIAFGMQASSVFTTTALVVMGLSILTALGLLATDSFRDRLHRLRPAFFLELESRGVDLAHFDEDRARVWLRQVGMPTNTWF